MGLRTQNDPIPEGERAFIMASNIKALEEGYLPVKENSFETRDANEQEDK